ncbi:MAG TPA: aromatic hydrocarbon degradation protein [Persephonella sp.]|uniref:Membrane protein involved in aromatic hydrocarbon degradation n=1 Tax=Persephonella marina (strain DSM 14350 / EX-H1) TaxID=123214 RepID=C0QP59_PERMH|nr:MULTISPECIES: outer membrane protein transport protein [Persephonella]ACO04459.1 membrane protein involved in aromatic hydrocarbon degradation [Persephonella marina EX-H1]HCB69930.1 aromatic hydrocarbon degradation protein [Persephonella sp.]
MKKVVGLAAVLSSALLTTSAFATNGDNMIGVSPASRAMGGIGVGMCVGPTDAIFRNPAWLSREKGFNVSFGGILFMPHVKGRSKGYFDTDPANPGGVVSTDTGYVTSKADTFMIPEIAITNQISDNVVIGIGAYGVSGMGVDYRDKNLALGPDGKYHNGLAKMHTTLQFMRIVPAVGYKVNEALTVGGALHLAWGSLDLGAELGYDSDGDGIPDTFFNAGGGQSQSYGIGASLGINFKPTENICIGASYQSSVKMTYKNVFDSNGDGKFEDLKLEQPQEFAVGVGYRPVETFKIGFDVRWINWSDADGYKQFKWEDQWVFAVGGEYKVTPKLALRAGYNYGKTPIKSKSNLNTANANNIPDFSQPFPDYNVEWFNLIGFPAIAEQHITLGFGYQFTEKFTLNMSYVRAFEKKVESSASVMASKDLIAGAKNAQDSIGISLDWHF